MEERTDGELAAFEAHRVGQCLLDPLDLPLRKKPVLQALGELAALEAHRVGQCLLDA